MVISFCMVLNFASFGLLFLVLANAAAVGDVVLIAASDATLLFVAALFAIVFNVVLAVLLFRGHLRARREDEEPQDVRSPI